MTLQLTVGGGGNNVTLHSPVNHLAECQTLVGELRPPPVQHYLVYGAHETRSGLRNEDHVRDERESVELQLRDV